MQLTGTFTIVAGSSAPDVGYSKEIPIGSITGTVAGYEVLDMLFIDNSGDEEIHLVVKGTNEAGFVNSISYTGADGPVILNAVDATIDTSTECQVLYAWPVTGTHFVDGHTYAISYNVNAQVNCGCTDDTNFETLAQLRRRMLVRLGYSAQADNPPPGMSDLLNDFLIQAQRLLYRRFKALREERFFSWKLVTGQRFYDLPANDETFAGKLDPLEVTWAGIEDTRGIWYELIAGIPPQFYTAIAFNGYPTRYEIRQCIEIFPAPAATALTLRMKGRFGLLSFVNDNDKTTIDSELVFLWALGNAKAHYSQPDANNIVAQANAYLRDLNAGLHTTKRYVPGTNPAQPWTQPKFLPLGTS